MENNLLKAFPYKKAKPWHNRPNLHGFFKVLLELEKPNGFFMKPKVADSVCFAGMSAMIVLFAKDVKFYTVKSGHRKRHVFGLRVPMT